MAKTIVVGGSGFIGSRLIPLLQKQGQVLNLDKTGTSQFPEITRIVDIRQPASLADNFRGADTVVLLAAEHRDDVTPISLYYDVNVQGMRTVLAEMDRFAVRRIVFTSTVAVYGLDKTSAPRETDTAEPFNHYGRSKLEAEEILRGWVLGGDGRSALILRPTVIFGEANRGNVFNLLNQIYSGKFLMIGDGRNRKSMSYVGNVVAFIEFMMERGWTSLEVLNYVDTPDFDMNTLVSEVYQFKGQRPSKLRIPYALGIFAGMLFDVVARLTGRNFPISSIRIRKFCASTEVDGSKLNSVGFVRPFSLSGGLQRMLAAEFQKN